MRRSWPIVEEVFDESDPLPHSEPPTCPGQSSTWSPSASRLRSVPQSARAPSSDATARWPGELVLTDLYYPCWKVTLDGKPAELHRVDYLLRGTTLPPGRHRVEFRYEPASWRAGWIVSLVAFAGLIVAVSAGLRRRA